MPKVCLQHKSETLSKKHITVPRSYNHIYNRLVEEKGDLIGYIAYALYKDEKIEYITRFKEEHGKDPDEEDLKRFHDITSTEASVDRYRYVASGILQSFLDNTLESTRTQIEDNLNRNHIELLRKAIKPIEPPSKGWSYFHGIMQSVAGAFLFMILMCALVFLLNLSRHTYTFKFGGNGNAEIEQVDTLKLTR